MLVFTVFTLIVFIIQALISPHGILSASINRLPSSHKNSTNAAKSCGLEGKCDMTTGAICLYDDQIGCMRKFPSECHLQVVACLMNITFNDYSSIYCEMEAFLCEDQYERWTIFFGND